MRRLFGIEGLACAGCARGLEGRLKSLPGIRSAGVHYLTASALIDWDEDRLGPAEISSAVAAAGYKMAERHRPDDIAEGLAQEIRRLSVRLAVAVFAGMWSMAPALVLYFARLPAEIGWWLALVSGIFALPVLFWAGSGILWMAWKSVALRAPGMDLLIALGALSATGLSMYSLWQGRSEVWFDTATMLVTLLLLGRLVDAFTRKSAVDALSAMEAATPETVLVQRDGTWSVAQARELPIGTEFAVDAGAPVALDGVIVSGESLVNRAVLTGESRLEPVQAGQRVEAGSINMSRRLILRSDRAFGDRALDRMGGAVAIELARKGTRASKADLWAARLSVVIPLLAAVTAFASLLLGVAPMESTLRGLTLLVAACPCALAIALPLAEMRAANVAAGLGLRIRDVEGFHMLAHLRALVFDKTGTLTADELSLSAVRPHEGVTEQELLAAAACAETGIDHPIARAVVRAYGAEHGAGGERMARLARGQTPDGAKVEVMAAKNPVDQSASWLSVTRNGAEIGQLALSDQMRPETPAVLAALAAADVQIAMATGDSQIAAENCASAVGIAPDRVRAACTPLDKVTYLRSLPRPVAFVGDGVNDGPALTAADCGISVASAHGSAAQTAGLVIQSGGLEPILQAITLSQALGRVARQNLWMAVGYNALMLPLAALGLLAPEAAAAAMLLSSVSVVLNSLRLSGHP